LTSAWLGWAASASGYQDITPGTAAGAKTGFTVAFRKAPSGWIHDDVCNDCESQAAALFALPLSSSNVIAAATDNGVATINYDDSGYTGDFPPMRDIGSENLTMVKGSGSCCDPNSATFNPNNEDDQFVMQASGSVYIPSPGYWTFLVGSDDGFLLKMGANKAVVGEFSGGRTWGYGDNEGGTPGDAGVSDSVAQVPSAGYYPFELEYWQGVDAAAVEFFAVPGDHYEPTDGGSGYVPKCIRKGKGGEGACPTLVGDTADGGLAVHQAGGGTVALTTAASVSQGHVLSDAATVHGGSDPGGELIFQIFGQGDPNCQNTPLQSATVPVRGDGDYSSGSFTVQAPGKYNFLVFYEPGSSPNESTRTSCGGGAETVTVYPPPSASITTPRNGVFYALRQVVSSSFACTDGSGAPGIGSCTGPVAAGAPINTSTLGVHAFVVTATSRDGWTASALSRYGVAGVPYVSFSAPRRVNKGQVALGRYRCHDGAGGPGIRSCDGSVHSGARLNTSRIGRHRISVTATSRDGLSRTYTFTYRVKGGSRKHRGRARAAALNPLSIW
jgi:hypothetical protein